MIVGGKKDFLWLYFWSLFAALGDKSNLNEGLEYVCLVDSTNDELLDSFVQAVLKFA